MIESFEKRKELEEKIDKAKWINLAKVILNRFGLDILLAFKDAREKEILNDTIQFLQDKNIENVLEILRISKDVSELKSNFDHFISKNSEITKEFLFFIKARNHFPQVLSNLKIYLNDLLSPNDPLKFLYDNDLFFFPEAEYNIINKIEKVFSQNLYTNDMPEPDLIIRTSGEQRLSNFMLWQAAYAEFVFHDVLWPDFTQDSLLSAIDEYYKRDRRYGARP